MSDPIGQAIHDYYVNGFAGDVMIETNYTEDEIISPSYFFRTPEEMPGIEQTALSLCKGKILDIGAAAGCHALPLQQQGFEVIALEKSLLSAEVMRKRGIVSVVCDDVYNYHTKGFDTVLVLMNGTGIGESLKGLKKLLQHLKKLLSKEGSILIDSSDISYLFMEPDGSMWVDLASDRYYGEMEYTVSYKNQQSVFNWLFVDFMTLKKTARSAGLKCDLIQKGIHFDYIARLFL